MSECLACKGKGLLVVTLRYEVLITRVLKECRLCGGTGQASDSDSRLWMTRRIKVKTD